MPWSRALLLTLTLCACTSAPEPGPASAGGSETTSGERGESSESSESSERGGPSEGESGETGVAEVEVSVKWIEVAADDYKLELQPSFDAAIHEYTALADGPDIAVYVDVIVDADVDAVLVNDVPAELIGFRMWRSAAATGLVSPCSASVVVELAGATVPDAYAIDVVAP